MAKETNRLTPLRVKSLTKPGRYADGDRLYLNVSKKGARSWVLIYRWNGRPKEAGLGSLADVPLKSARIKAKEGGELLARKPPIDPLTVWRKPEREEIPTFAPATTTYLESKIAGWRNARHQRQVAAMLAKHCGSLARIPVNEIATADVLKVVKPVWNRTPPTANRLRGHIEGVLNVARAHGHIPTDAPNPARWKGHLELLLPKRSSVTQNFAAMPYAEVPTFVGELRELRCDATGAFCVPAFALEFTILTVARSAETLGALWVEIDWTERKWTLPAGRTKAQREHVVPLSSGAIAVLEAVREISSSPLIFPGARKYAPAPGKVFERMLQRMGRAVTTHGFRSSFRDWCGDETEHSRETAEAALAHVVGDRTERAYRRGDALKKRRALMEAWSAYVTGAEPEGNVVPLRA
jgi:integrase